MCSKAIARMSPDPVAILRDAWRSARQSLNFTSVHGRQETSTHHLHIGGYSTISSVYKHREGIESRKFRAGGHRWKITYYPNSPSESGSPRVDLTLMETRLLGDTTEATAGLTVSILDRDGNQLCSRCVRPQHYTSWGSTDIGMDVSEQTKAALRRLKDDRLVIRCDLTVHSSAKESRLRWLLRSFLD